MLPFVLTAAGALGISITTALEVVTAPHSAHVVAFPINGAVHLVKVLAVAAFVTGMAAFAVGFRRRLGVIGSIAAAALAFATLVGVVPYTLAEVSLDPSLVPARANAELEAIYAANPWISGLASVALPVVVMAIVVFAVVVLRRRLFPAWAPAVSLAAIPVGIAATVLAESAGLPLPHPPAWIFLGTAAYGLAGVARPWIGGQERAPVPGPQRG